MVPMKVHNKLLEKGGFTFSDNKMAYQSCRLSYSISHSAAHQISLHYKCRGMICELGMVQESAMCTLPPSTYLLLQQSLRTGPLKVFKECFYTAAVKPSLDCFKMDYFTGVVQQSKRLTKTELSNLSKMSQGLFCTKCGEHQITVRGRKQ